MEINVYELIGYYDIQISFRKRKLCILMPKAWWNMKTLLSNKGRCKYVKFLKWRKKEV